MAVPAAALIRPARSRQQKQPETDSLLKQIGRTTGSGAQYAAETLSKPSRALWGSVSYLTGGDAGGGLLNLIPFSDTMGLTDPSKGIELDKYLENLGVLPKNKPGFDRYDPLRFVAAVGGDPTSYVGGVLLKSLGKGGAVLAKASPAVGKLSRAQRMTTTVGQMARQIAPEALERAAKGSKYADAASFIARHGDEPVGGLLLLHKGPLGGPVAAIGTGNVAQKIGGALDVAGHAVRYSPVGRVGAAVFSRPARGALTETGQQLARVATEGERAAGVAAREQFAEPLRMFEEFSQTLPDTKARLDANDALRAAVENTAPLRPDMAHLQPVVDQMRKINADMPALEQAEGVVSPVLDDLFADYNRRQRFFFPGDKSKSDFPSLLLSGRHGSQTQRADILRDMQGGTSLINRLSLDPQLSGLAHKMTPGQLKDKAFWDQQETLVNAAMQQAGFPNWMYEHSRQLAKWLADLDPRHVSESVPVFPHNPVQEAMRRAELGGRAVEMAKAIRGGIKGQATDPYSIVGGVPVKDVVERAGLDVPATMQLMGLADDAHIPRELAEDIGRVIKTFRNPDEVGVVIKAIDKFTSLFKVGVLTWPARYTRDLTSGQIQNFLTGMWSWKDMNDADRLIRGRGPIQGLQKLGGKYANLSDEAATKAFANEIFAHEVASTSQGITSQAGVAGTELSRSVATEIPGVQPLLFRNIAKKAIPKSLEEANFINVAGVRGTETRFSLAAAGNDLGRYTDSNIRITGYLNLRRKGFSPQQAAEKVRLAQVDYKNLSATEQAVFRRLMPFYSFSRGMAEFLVKELADRPGGGIGQSIRAMNAGRTEEPMPDYVSQTAAIPLGQLPSGDQRFITGLGLMHEDPLALLTSRGGVPDFTDTLAEVGSRFNPLAKYPIEAATGESLFQRGPMGGRDVLDQDPTIGRLISNVGELAGAQPRTLPSGRAKPFISHGFEQLAANLPTSRLLTTARTLTDKRKLEGGPFPGSAALANVLSGVKVSDISPAASDAMLRDEADALMRELGAQSYNVTRFTKSQLENATPDERERMLAFNAVKDELAARSKARKAQKPKVRAAR